MKTTKEILKERTEVMFWNKHNEAILFGTVSKLSFDTMYDAMQFVEKIEVEGCTEVSFNGYTYGVIKE